MSKLSAVMLSVAVAVSGVACAPKSVPYNPFKVPRDQFYGSLKTVALAPMRAPKDLEERDEVEARFIALVESRLRRAGLRVIPSSETGPVLEAAIGAQGGLYDPATGQLDRTKSQAALREALAQLKTKYAADAMLRVDLSVVNATLSRDVARWDGATDSAGTGFWKAVLVGSHSGRVPALSLIARLISADGSDLYVKAGGLRVIVKVNAKGQLVPIPQSELFDDPQRNENALRIALNPLLGFTDPEPGEVAEAAAN